MKFKLPVRVSKARFIFFSFFLFPLTLFPLTLLSQAPQDWDAFSQRIDVKAYAGKRFKLQADVKVQQIDATAEALLWVSVEKRNKKRGFFHNMADRPIRVAQWQQFTIEGKIDKDGEGLFVGGIFFRKGIFFFDNFRLFVETSATNFVEIKIPNGDFEAENLRPYWGYRETWNGFTTEASTETASEGKKSLRVDGSKFKKPLVFGDNDSVGRYANVNGIRLYYEEYGRGEPVLLLHGNRQSISDFNNQIPELAKHYRVIAVDTRGQGKSSEDGKTYTYDLFASDMKAFLDHLKVDSANIVGWSDGGNTGLIMAMKYPVKVKKLITMGANIFMNNSVVVKGVIREINKQINFFSEDTSYMGTNNVRLLNMLSTEPRYQFGDLKEVHCPVLIMAGEKDLIKAEHTKGIAANVQNGQLLIVPKETHDFPSENAEEFNRIVIEFLGKIK